MISFFLHYMRRTRRVMRGQWGTTLFFLGAIFAYAATGFMYFELPANPDLKWGDAMWWAVVTMTTVGYGDFFPVTPAGRFFVGYPTMLVGVAILGYMLSYVASLILESKIRELKGMKQIKLEGHIIICRYTTLANMLNVVNELRRDDSTDRSLIVLVDEHLEELPKELKEQEVWFVRGDPARQAVLEQANFEKASHVVIQADAADLVNSDHRNLAVALTIERLRPDVTTIIECVNPENAIFFERANCDSIVCISALSSQLVVQELQDPGIHAVLSQLTTNAQGKQFYIVDIEPSHRTFADVDAHYRNERAVTLGLRRGSENLLLPDGATPVSQGDQAILVAERRPT